LLAMADDWESQLNGGEPLVEAESLAETILDAMYSEGSRK